jgi:hypothetical protein
MGKAQFNAVMPFVVLVAEPTPDNSGVARYRPLLGTLGRVLEDVVTL